MTLINKIELAIAANGGSELDKEACECEKFSFEAYPASVCRYCAIRDALNDALSYVTKEANDKCQPVPPENQPLTHKPRTAVPLWFAFTTLYMDRTIKINVPEAKRARR